MKQEQPISSPSHATQAEILVPGSPGSLSPTSPPTQGVSDQRGFPASCQPTTAKHGMTGPEIERLDGASHFMAKPCPRSSQLFFASVHHATSRDIIADIQKRITKLQNAANLPPYSAWVFENSGGLHAHLIFIGDRGGSIAGRLEGSAKFGALLHVGPVTDLRGLTRNYLVKERTPQAGWRRQNLLGGRIKGSHGLKGGGDRVRLSRELERDAIEAGYVEPWQHTNARRSVVRKAYSPRPRRDGAPLPGTQNPCGPRFLATVMSTSTTSVSTATGTSLLPMGVD